VVRNTTCPFSPPFFLCASEFCSPPRASAAPAVGSPDPNPNRPSRVFRCVSHVVLYLPGQTSSKMEPGRPRSTNAGEAPPRAPICPGPLDSRWTVKIRSCQSRSEPPDLDPSIRIGRYQFGLIFNPSRRIRSRRARLDPSQIRSEPSDLDLTVQIIR
jgi:hypothetical protein